MHWKLITLFVGLGISMLACGVNPSPPTATLFVPPTSVPTQLPPTPAITDTLTPTNTQLPPSLSAEDRKYLAKLLPMVLMMEAALDDIGTNSNAAGETPELLFETWWRAGQELDFRFVHRSYLESSGIESTPAFSEFHIKFIQASNDCDAAAASYVKSLTNLDTDSLEQAVSLFDSCGNKLHASLDVLNVQVARFGEVTGQENDERLTLVYLNERKAVLLIAHEVKIEFDSTFGKFIEGKVAGSDAQWQTQSENLILQFRGVIKYYKSMNAPSLFMEAHSKTLDAMENCDLGFTTLLNAVKANNQTQYQSGIPYIGSCNTEWNESNQLIADAITASGIMDEFVFAGPSP